MTYTPIQLEIIRVFGRKELTEGCIIQDTDDSTYVRYAFDDEYGFPIIVQLETKFKGQYDDIEMEDLQNEGEWKILGHIPEIFPDVAILAEERGWLLEIKFGLLTIHFKDRTFTSCKYNTILPLLEQPESVLIQLLNLFK